MLSPENIDRTNDYLHVAIDAIGALLLLIGIWWVGGDHWYVVYSLGVIVLREMLHRARVAWMFRQVEKER
jgi:hypothetical protein